MVSTMRAASSPAVRYIALTQGESAHLNFPDEIDE